MLEKPHITDEELIDSLQKNFNVNVRAIEFLPIGYDAQAGVYRVDTDEKPYFLKVKKGRFRESSFKVPHFLKSVGIEQIVAPIPNREQSLWTQSGDFKLILYPFVDGDNGMDVGLSDDQWRVFGAILEQIHAIDIPPDIAKITRREDFVPIHGQSVRDLDAYIQETTFDNLHQQNLVAFWQERRDEILKILARAEELGQQLQQEKLDFVLCHSDIHIANTLIDRDGNVQIIDWDEVCIAPKERDLMFIEGASAGGSLRVPEHQTAIFLEVYQPKSINRTAMAYYRYEWVVQEIGEFGNSILHQELTDESRAIFVQDFKSCFAVDGVVEAAYEEEHKL
jgi:spectinomycin phosphotransferase